MQEILPDGTRRRWPRCVVCYLFNLRPIRYSVDRSQNPTCEADTLCVIHRARATEGYCVMCARRAVWAIIFKDTETGCCRACFAKQYGTRWARQLERGRKGWPEGLWYLRDAA